MGPNDEARALGSDFANSSAMGGQSSCVGDLSMHRFIVQLFAELNMSLCYFIKYTSSNPGFNTADKKIINADLPHTLNVSFPKRF